jgi:hypothetical protein
MAATLEGNRMMRAIYVGILALAIAGCSGGGTGDLPLDELASLFPVGSDEPSDDFPEPVDPEEPPSGPPPGTWTGTIVIEAVIDFSKTEDTSSGDPGSVYYEEQTVNEEIQLTATDTFTIDAPDPDDLVYGIHQVDFEGTASNSGNTLERYVTLSDKQNSGCTWNEEQGQETIGSWSGDGEPVGYVQFSEDGSYYISLRADYSDEAEVPKRTWLEYTNISANCEPNYAPYDTTEPWSPLVQWASQYLGSSDVNGVYSQIEGQLNASNPGSVVEGSMSWEMDFPEGLTLTATWNLVHDSPIVLPHG